MSCDQGEIEMYHNYVNTLFDQWLKRETWCAVMANIPDKQRRHYPNSSRHQIQITGGCNKGSYIPYGPVHFPPSRRQFPCKKNVSNLQGYF